MKSFTDIFIRRPVLATVLSLLILLIGIRAFFSLSVREFPEISATVVTINTTYTGANSDLMEGFVTTPIENAIAGVDGLDYITSSSTQGSSQIIANFNMGYDINTAVSDINANVNSIRWKLPKEINDPVISKEDPNAEATMYLSFNSDTLSNEKITDYLIRVIQPQLQTLPGVGKADVWGREYSMRIWLNPQLMAAHNITFSDIQSKLMTNNYQSPTGTLDSAFQRFNVTADTDVGTEKQFNNLIIGNTGDSPIRIQDIGRADLGAKSTDISVLMGGANSVIIPITPKADANPLAISKEVRKILPSLTSSMPKEINAKIFYDAATYIQKSIDEVISTIIEASIFVMLVVFLFLGSFRVLLVPTITMPLSIIGVFGAMLMLGYTINTLTLLAMVLAIGMVVDDAIVVSENIHRHISGGLTPFQAALKGTSEIKFAIISMTFTLAAVYAPIGFMSGLTGSLFTEFAFTLASAVIISGFIALTLSPMMCSKVMSAEALNAKLPTFIHAVTEKIAAAYAVILRKVLKARPLVLAGIIIVLAACYALFIFTPQELAPNEDKGALFSVVTAPSSANLKYTERFTDEMAKIYTTIPQIAEYLIVNGVPTGVNTAMSVVTLTDWSKRKISSFSLVNMLRKAFYMIPGIQAYPLNPPPLPGAGSMMPIGFVMQTTGSFSELNKYMQKFIAAVRKNPRIIYPDSDLKIDKPQVDTHINRDLAANLGISMYDIGTTLSIALGQPTVNYFTMFGRSYDVIPQLEDQFREMPSSLNNLNLRTQSGELVPLSNLVKINESIQPQSLNHFQQLRSATFQGSVVPGYTLGQALDYLKHVAKQVLPKNIKIDYSGQSRQYIQASGTMTITFIFAIIFIYLILAAQFESFRDPLIVMFSVPLSTIGALILLHFTGGTLNIYSEIGLVTLIGLISKHGILLVEFANQLQEQGEEFREAIVKAARIRLRPILMTTFAMILGALPLVLAHGAGAVSRNQLGMTIVGGMSIGTLFTLFVVPTMYTYLATRKAKHAASE